jgi:glycosyltransferase involved in cell wall biosynthesis
MIEAMACGTPAIAFRCGSVPEVIEDGLTGFIVDDVAGAVRALADLHRLDRRRIRAEFERRFTADRMASDYVAVYNSLLSVLELPLGAAPRSLGRSRTRLIEGDELGTVTAA